MSRPSTAGVGIRASRRSRNVYRESSRVPPKSSQGMRKKSHAVTTDDIRLQSMGKQERDEFMLAVQRILDAQAKAKQRVRRRRKKHRADGGFVPGPTGKYVRRGGGKISEANPKSYIDWVVYRSRDMPGPARYNPKLRVSSQGVNISDASPKSELEEIIHRSKQIPGPMRYSPKLLPGASFTTKISDANPKSEIDWVIARSSKIPGPADYNISSCPYLPTQASLKKRVRRRQMRRTVRA